MHSSNAYAMIYDKITMEKVQIETKYKNRNIYWTKKNQPTEDIVII